MNGGDYFPIVEHIFFYYYSHHPSFQGKTIYRNKIMEININICNLMLSQDTCSKKVGSKIISIIRMVVLIEKLH